MKREAVRLAVAAVDPAARPPPAATARKPLRFLTAGSVDDGKSTLIGRLLLDGQALLADQIDALSARAAGAPIDLALVTDGLEAEREQGITIDVAYRYFATRVRKFIIADAPGHEQYTRNMVTAAAGSDAAVVLVDVTKLALDAAPLPPSTPPADDATETTLDGGDGVPPPLLADDASGAGRDADAAAPPALLPQTRRHALIARLLRVPHIVFAVNKLDAVADASHVFARVRAAIEAFAASAGIAPAGIVPISALHGDNVSTPSTFVDYRGPTLLALLEALADDGADANEGPAMLPVQFVDGGSSGHRGGAHRPPGPHAHDAGGAAHGRVGPRARVLWGRVARGRIALGEELVAWPGGEHARVAELHGNGGRATVIAAGRSAGIVLDRQIDVSRGDWLAAPGTLTPASTFTATLAWFDNEPAVVGRKYLLRHGNRWLHGRLAGIEHRIDIASLATVAAERLAGNDIGTVRIDAQEAIPLRRFADDRAAGALVVVDPATHRTSGVLLVA